MVKSFHFISHLFPCTAHPLLVDDRGLTSNPPYINVSVNSLCQDDKYIITVQFGVRADGSMDCNFQQNATAINGIVEVPSSITGQEYCYRAVLSIGGGGIIDGILIHHGHAWTYIDRHRDAWTCMDIWTCVVTVKHF